MMVLMAAQQLVAGGQFAVAFFVRREQLDADPHQQQCANELEPWQGQQGHGEEDQDHAQDDGASGAPDDALGALSGRQLAAGQRDDHRVVAAEQDVDHDDLPEGDPERGRSQEIHKFLVVVCSNARRLHLARPKPLVKHGVLLRPPRKRTIVRSGGICRRTQFPQRRMH